MGKYLPFALLILSATILHAEIGATQQECIARYGKPERDSLKEGGLLYFRRDGLCTIAHFYRGSCDMLSIFSSAEQMGFPEELSGEKIAALLKSEGNSAEWNAVPRFSINGVWNSGDYKSFAIYDTMRHKLVIMTHDAYSREEKAKKTSQRANRQSLNR
jgi:hypothetical protein